MDAAGMGVEIARGVGREGGGVVITFIFLFNIR
jgi:hypothetical protein